MVIMDIIDILGLTLIAINFLIVLPISIICTLRISKHCKEPHFHKRYPWLLYYIIIFALLYITINATYYILINIISFINISYLLYIDQIPSNISLLIDPILSCFTILICLLCMFWRTWMLYFDHNYHLGRSDVWRRNVGSIIERSKNNWFDSYKSTLGKSSFINKLIIILWFILTIITICTVYFINNNNIIIHQLIFCVFILIFVCCMIYLIHGIQSQWDFVHIRAELSWHLLFILSGTICYIIITSIFTVYGINDRIKHLCIAFIVLCTMYGILYMLIGFPLISWSSDNKRNRRISAVMPNRQSRVLPLTSILKDAEAFELFMLHLVKEFAVENLLFICELMQFKQHLQVGILKPMLLENEEHDESILPESELFIMDLPMDIIPKSSLIKHSKSYLSAARCIYNKYIKNGCEFEINISSRTRHELNDFFNAMYPHNPEELHHNKLKQPKLNNTNTSIIESMTAETLLSTTINLNNHQSRSQLKLKNEISDHIAKHILGTNINIDIDIDKNSDHEIDELELDIIDEKLDDMVTALQFRDNKQIQSEKEVSTQISMAFDGPSELDLFAVFDHAKDEILSVLNDSYQRFACSKQYTQIEPKILKKHHKKNQSQSFKRSMISGAKMLIKQVSSNGKRLSSNNMNLGIELNHSPNLSSRSNTNNNGNNNDHLIINYSPTPSSQIEEETNLKNNNNELKDLELST